LIIKPATSTWVTFPVTNETEVHHDKGSGAKYHVALDENGNPIVCDGWKVNYGIVYANGTIAWDWTPPLYVQSVAHRLVKENR
jgi:hypothetical protein